jgi:uncharacterized delta-60 repeat protein
MSKRLIFLVKTLLVLSLAAAAPLFAQSANDGFDPLGANNGGIFVVAPTGGASMYVGGNFTAIGGLSRSGIARINNDGSGDALFNAVGVKKLDGGNLFPGTVNTIVIQNDGKIVIGGDFTEVNGVARSNIARLDQFGALDTGFIANTNGPVYGLVLQPGGEVIAGGAFTTVNGTARSNLVRLSPFGVVDTTTNFNVTGSVIYGLKRDDKTGRIYVGGIMSAIGGVQQPNAARLNADGKTVDPTFLPAVPTAGSSFAVQADGKIVVGHSNGVVRLKPDGSLDPTLSISTSAWVDETVIQPDGKILIGGFFSSINGTPRANVARLNLDGTLDQGFNPNLASTLPGGIRLGAIALQRDQKILIGGIFTSAGGQTRRGLARVYPDGAVEQTTNASVGGGIPLAILPLADGKTLLGGNFTSVGGQNYSRMARLNSGGAVDTTFPNLNMNGEVNDFAVQPDGKILVAGSFTTIAGVNQQFLARLNTNGTRDTSFLPGISNAVYAVAVQADGKILIGGVFDIVSGTGIGKLARLNPNGTLDTSFAPLVNDGVYKIRIQADGKILIGGYFTSVGGQARRGIARLNTNGSLDTSVNVNLNGLLGEVYDIALQSDGKILFGGAFTGINGSTTNAYVARLLPTGAVDTSFSGTADSSVNSIALQADGKIVVAGRFNTLSGTARQYLGRLNGNGTLDTAFTMNAADTMTAIALQRDGKIVAGGNFTTIGGQARSRLAKIANTEFSAETVWTTSPRLIEWNNTGTSPQILRVTYEKSTDGVNFVPLGNAAQNNLPSTIWSLTGAGFGAGYIRIRAFYNDHSSQKSFIESIVYVPLKNTIFDFDGDGKSDVGIFRSLDGSWWYQQSSNALVRVYSFGVDTDRLVPGDYTGDGKSDVAVFRTASGRWFILRSEDSSYFDFPFGTNGDIPVPSDFDGDGRTDAAVFRPASATWFISNSGGGTSIVQFGSAQDKPVPADYDGDGKADIAIFRPSDGSWWYLRSTDNQFRVFRFGLGTDKAVPGDFTGDGKADLAVWRESDGFWYIQRSEDASFYSVPFGTAGDVPAPGDYDGDGRFDPAVFRPSTANWFIQRSTGGTAITTFGTSGDRPIPNAFVP